MRAQGEPVHRVSPIGDAVAPIGVDRDELSTAAILSPGAARDPLAQRTSPLPSDAHSWVYVCAPVQGEPASRLSPVGGSGGTVGGSDGTVGGGGSCGIKRGRDLSDECYSAHGGDDDDDHDYHDYRNDTINRNVDTGATSAAPTVQFSVDEGAEPRSSHLSKAIHPVMTLACSATVALGQGLTAVALAEALLGGRTHVARLTALRFKPETWDVAVSLLEEPFLLAQRHLSTASTTTTSPPPAAERIVANVISANILGMLSAVMSMSWRLDDVDVTLKASEVGAILNLPHGLTVRRRRCDEIEIALTRTWRLLWAIASRGGCIGKEVASASGWRPTPPSSILLENQIAAIAELISLLFTLIDAGLRDVGAGGLGVGDGDGSTIGSTSARRPARPPAVELWWPVVRPLDVLRAEWLRALCSAMWNALALLRGTQLQSFWGALGWGRRRPQAWCCEDIDNSVGMGDRVVAAVSGVSSCQELVFALGFKSRYDMELESVPAQQLIFATYPSDMLILNDCGNLSSLSAMRYSLHLASLPVEGSAAEVEHMALFRDPLADSSEAIIVLQEYRSTGSYRSAARREKDAWAQAAARGRGAASSAASGQNVPGVGAGSISGWLVLDPQRQQDGNRCFILRVVDNHNPTLYNDAAYEGGAGARGVRGGAADNGTHPLLIEHVGRHQDGGHVTPLEPRASPELHPHLTDEQRRTIKGRLWSRVLHAMAAVDSASRSELGLGVCLIDKLGAYVYDEQLGTKRYKSSRRCDGDAIRGFRMRFASVPVVTFQTAEELLEPYTGLLERLARLPTHAAYFSWRMGVTPGGPSDSGSGASEAMSSTPEHVAPPPPPQLVPAPGSILEHPLPIGAAVEARWKGKERCWLPAYVAGKSDALLIEGIDDDDERGGGDGDDDDGHGGSGGGAVHILDTGIVMEDVDGDFGDRHLSSSHRLRSSSQEALAEEFGGGHESSGISYCVHFVRDGEVADGLGMCDLRAPSEVSALEVRLFVAQQRGDDEVAAKLETRLEAKAKQSRASANSAAGKARSKAKLNEKAAQGSRSLTSYSRGRQP